MKYPIFSWILLLALLHGTQAFPGQDPFADLFWKSYQPLHEPLNPYAEGTVKRLEFKIKRTHEAIDHAKKYMRYLSQEYAARFSRDPRMTMEWMHVRHRFFNDTFHAFQAIGMSYKLVADSIEEFVRFFSEGVKPSSNAERAQRVQGALGVLSRQMRNLSGLYNDRANDYFSERQRWHVQMDRLEQASRTVKAYKLKDLDGNLIQNINTPRYLDGLASPFQEMDVIALTCSRFVTEPEWSEVFRAEQGLLGEANAIFTEF
jgi:hypothetical protein